MPKVQELYQKGIISENRLGNQVNGIDMTIHVLFALDQKKMSYTQLYDTLMIFPMVDEKRIIRVLDKLTDTDTTEEPPLIRDDGHTIQLTSDGQRFLDTFLKPVAGQLALLLQ